MSDTDLKLQSIVDILYKMQFSAKKEVTEISKKAIDYIWKELIKSQDKPKDWIYVSPHEISTLRLSTETYPNVYDSEVIKLAKEAESACYDYSSSIAYTEGCNKKSIDEEGAFWDTIENYCIEILNLLGYYDNY